MTPAELASRLHDGPLQALTAARLHLDTLTSRRDALPADVAQLVGAAHDAVVSASAQCRVLLDDVATIADHDG